MRLFLSILALLTLFVSLITSSSFRISTEAKSLVAQTDLGPLDILILDLKDVKRLIQDGDNKTAIVILKSALGEVRKVKEFDKSTKKTTEKRIKKGIQLLKQNKNDEALALVQTGINALIEGGLADASDFE